MSLPALTDKLLFLGVDGMDPDTTRRLIDAGKMPHTQALVERGACRQDLHMLGGVPTITPPMWMTLATGCSPNVHGITCFWSQSPDSLEELVYAFHSSLNKAEPLWNVTAEAGKKTLVFHWPAGSWPPSSDSPNLSVIDGTTPGCVNMGVSTIDAERLVSASEAFTEVRFKSKIPINNGAGCVINVVEDDDSEELSLSEKSTSGGNLKNLEFSFSDGEGSFEEMQIDMVNSPITAPTGWQFSLPADAKEFVLLASKGLVRRYGLLLKNAAGIYDTVQIYTSKKNPQPLVILNTQDYIKFGIVDTYMINNEEKTGCCSYAILDLEADGSFIRMHIGSQMDIYNDSHFHPHELYQKIVEHAGYITNATQTGGQYADLVEKLILPGWKQFMQWQSKAINYCIAEEHYEVIFSHMHNVDALGHQFWHWRKKRQRWEADPALYERFAEQCYRDTDEYIGSFLHLLDEGWTIFLFSDHGFLTSDEEEPPVLGDPFGINVPVMEQLGYTVLKKNSMGQPLKEIDWSQTRAVAARGNHIYLNLKDRYADGIVEPDEQYSLEEQIIDDLYNYRDPATGRRIVYLCMRNKDAALVGLGGAECGDILYWLNEGFNRGHGDSLPTFTGESGTCVSPIFVACGRGIKSGFYTNRTIREMDVTPTAAALLGVRMPADCEGAPAYQLLEPLS